jgi:hypothetical protein
MQAMGTSIRGLAVGAALLGLGAVDQASAYTVPAGLGTSPGTIGSVPGPGYPNFNNGANLTFSKLSSGAFKLTATTNSSSAFTFNTSPTQSWAVTGSSSGSKGSFALTANFNSSLAFQNGTVDITGKIPTYSGPGTVGTVKTTVQNLYHAALTGVGLDTSPVGLGFSTNAATDTGWASQFSPNGTSESVWFYSSNIWQTILSNVALNVGKKTWSISLNNIQAVTTVPVPAAVWLLGSALGFFGVFGRRRDPVGMMTA